MIESDAKPNSKNLDLFALNFNCRRQLSKLIDQYLENQCSTSDSIRINRRLNDTRTLEQYRVSQAVQQIKSLYLHDADFLAESAHVFSAPMWGTTKRNDVDRSSADSPYDDCKLYRVRSANELCSDSPLKFQSRSHKNRPKSTYGQRSSHLTINSSTISTKEANQARIQTSTKLHSKNQSNPTSILKQTTGKSRTIKCNDRKFSRTEIVFRFVGFGRKATTLETSQQMDGRCISVYQQTRPGTRLQLQFKDKVSIGQFFGVELRSHADSSFVLLLFVDDVRDVRLNTCCAYRHRPGTRVGHFLVHNVIGGLPCDSCVSMWSAIEKRNPSRKSSFLIHRDPIERTIERDVRGYDLQSFHTFRKLNHANRGQDGRISQEAIDAEAKDDDDQHSLSEFEKIEQQLRVGRDYDELRQKFELPSNQSLVADDTNEFDSYQSEESEESEQSEEKEKTSLSSESIAAFGERCYDIERETGDLESNHFQSKDQKDEHVSKDTPDGEEEDEEEKEEQDEEEEESEEKKSETGDEQEGVSLMKENREDEQEVEDDVEDEEEESNSQDLSEVQVGYKGQN